MTLPVSEVSTGLHCRFRPVIQLMEEVDTCQFFYLIHATHSLLHRLALTFIIVDKADGSRILTHTEHNLIESLGDSDTSRTRTYLLMLRASQQGTTDDVNLAIFASPLATEQLQIVPVVLVKIVVLRTDVCHEERLVNSQYFNLAGQRIAQPTKGLYIVNGKTYLVK